MTDILELIERYKKEVFPSLHQKTQKCRKNFLEYFILFLKAQNLTLNDITENTLKEYYTWFINQRNFQGICFKPKTTINMVCTARSFLNWLYDKNIIQVKFKAYSDLCLSKVTEDYRKRREEIRKQNINTPDEEIFKRYEIHFKQFKTCKTNTVLKVLDTIRKHLKSTDKSIKELTLSDYETIRENVLTLEAIPDRLFTQSSLVNCIRCIIHFEHWLFEEGYILKRQLEHWTRPELLKFIKQKKKEIKPKQHYYSISELMKSYKVRLQKRIKSHFMYQQTIKNINFYLQFLILQGKTIYTADIETIEAYKQYLLNYEYRPGYYYKAEVHLILLRDVKRFYDWLVLKKYFKDHPLKDFKRLEYKEWLQKNIKPDTLSSKEIGWYSSLLAGFMKYEEHKGFCIKTRNSHKKGCIIFFEYLGLCGIEDMKEVTRETLCNYLFYLNQYKNGKDTLLSTDSKIKLIAGVKSFCQYLEKYDLIENILSVAVEYPKNEKGLPTPGFNNREARQLIESAKGDTPKTLRNRVFFELLYSSGMRSNELCQLKVKNVDLINGMVRIDVPKGGRQYERVIPIGKKTCFWIERYINEVRPKQSKSSYLFLNKNDSPFITATILNAVKTHIMKLPLRKRRIITHSFRVSCATEMLRRGANVKIVQEQLGHKVITSTEKYLRLVPGDLKKAHTKYHPRG